MICAIHQPNFFPWLGYFDKIRRVDVFVFLDDVQNPKTGSSSYTNRVKMIDASEKEHWVTCPIMRPTGLVLINEVRYANNQWKKSFLAKIKHLYFKSKNFSRIYPFLEKILSFQDNELLYNLNIHAIETLSNHLGIMKKFIKKSELKIHSNSTQMLIDVCKALGATSYLCGGGASSYQQDHLFPENGIELQYQNFVPKPYGDPKTFIPGLSIIDFLMKADDYSW